VVEIDDESKPDQEESQKVVIVEEPPSTGCSIRLFATPQPPSSDDYFEEKLKSMSWETCKRLMLVDTAEMNAVNSFPQLTGEQGCMFC
jgi:hypothetical protein